MNQKIKTSLFLGPLFVLMSSLSYAQNSDLFETISISQGLSQGMVFDILQDREGFIWVATKNGLNRFDGYTFKVFVNDPYDSNSLSSNTIVELTEDKYGRIWVGTENAGVNIYDKKSGSFFRIANSGNDPKSLSGNNVDAIEELPNGKMIVAIENGGFNVISLKPDFFEQHTAPEITRLYLPNGTEVYGMGTDQKGRFWMGGMDKSVYQFDPSTYSFTALPQAILLNNGYLHPDGSLLINNNLFLSDGKAIFPLFDPKKNQAGNILFRPVQDLWRNHHREIYFYDVAKWEPGKAVKWNQDLPDNLHKILFYPFLIDRSGILWSGSLGYGLRKYNTASKQFDVQLPGYSVRFIVPKSSNELYLGNYAYGWRKLEGDSIDANPFSSIPEITQIDNFIIARSGEYFIKSDNKGYYAYRKETKQLTPLPDINYYEGHGDKQPMIEDRKGNIIIPGLGGEFNKLNSVTRTLKKISINTNPAKPMLSNAICTALYEDKQGSFWIGTAEGFAKLIFSDGDKPVTTWYYNNSSDRNSLNYNHVSAFLDDPKKPEKYLWIGTKGGGLNRLNKITGDFMHLTTKDGLPDDVVYGMLHDEAGNIWGSTNRGIFCLTAQKEKDSISWRFRNFTKAYGLQDDEFNTGAYAKLPDGRLAFGGVNGLNIFNPTAILSEGYTPNVFITSIMVNNAPVVAADKTGVLSQNIESTQSITLNYLQDILTLEFASLDYTAPNQNRYRYQMLGADKDWIESGSRRSATYLHLPSGKYTFKVQGSNSQGIWSDKITSLQITVLPPWWRSWWAYICYGLLLVMAIRAYLKFSVNRARLKSQLNFEQREAKRIKEIDGLKTQLYTNITHEFRTPLTVILGMAEQVKNNPVEHGKNGINMIIRNGESLLKLVNEMLDLSKLETGKMSLQLAQADVITFLRYIVESFNSLAESQGKQLHFLSSADNLSIAFDQEKLRQIVSNLLSNALKFTPEKGNIYISIDVENKHEGNRLLIKVKDTGMGIPESQLPNIFDRFYQLDNSITRSIGGTGIGLSLTKELVKLMDGQIEVKSPPTGANRGTEFTVTLPVKKILATESDTKVSSVEKISPTYLEYVVAATEASSNNLQQPLILLVEDNADVVAYTASCLPEYRLAVGKDGREGFEIATEIIPDLIITDVMMPFVDGFEMCRKLRSTEQTSHIPIIMLTAKADIESRMEGLREGADAYLQKPFHKEELLIRIQKLLELRKQLQEVYMKRAGINAVSHPVTHEENKPPATAANDKAADEFVTKIEAFVEAHLADEQLAVDQICKLVFMSHSQLHRKLEAVTGLSPNKFIRMVRLNRALLLLKDPQRSISSIAQECGYSDPGYFARVFKQEYGITAQEWRMKQHDA